jgi:8-oxo-dGTP diphosphatase
MIEATLCLLTRGDPATGVLLGYKKAGFGSGKYTGFGGKVEVGETPVEAAARELVEETGLWVPPENLGHVGDLTFIFPARPSWSQRVHVFLATSWEGEPAESREMAPTCFAVDAIPFDQMWHDARYWLPPILDGQRLRARFTFGDDNETVSAVVIEPWVEAARGEAG